MSKAEAKRRFQLGTKWRFVYSSRSGGTHSPQFRQVVHKQTNAVAFSKSDNPDHIVLATKAPHKNATWLYFDQKGDVFTIKGDCVISTYYNEEGNATIELIYEQIKE